ncbi:MAG: VanZ family protein, partial [Sphaerobacter sp.]|nr:VanZ family protein [Sphaerobacter sp.]
RVSIARRWVAVALWATVIFMLSSRSQVPSPLGISGTLTSIAGHLVAYGILGYLLVEAVGVSRVEPGTTARLALLLAVLYGISDEWHQSFVPGRDASLGDLFVDAVGAWLGVALQQTRAAVRGLRRTRRS